MKLWHFLRTFSPTAHCHHRRYLDFVLLAALPALPAAAAGTAWHSLWRSASWETRQQHCHVSHHLLSWLKSPATPELSDWAQHLPDAAVLFQLWGKASYSWHRGFAAAPLHQGHLRSGETAPCLWAIHCHSVISSICNSQWNLKTEGQLK